MKIIDALNILAITEKEISLEAVKKAYRQACKAYHPDINPAGTVMMQAVNEAFESLSKENFPIQLNEFDTVNNYGEALNIALNEIINLMGLTIEICGAWIWVSGETKVHKEILKKADFIWSSQKGMWYFRPQAIKSRWYCGKLSLDEIRVKYGSEKVNTRFIKALS